MQETLSHSLWSATARLPTFPKLSGDFNTDVVVVGAGITGVTAALLLRRAGLRVVVLESGVVGGGVTGRTTAHITEVLDARYHQLAVDFGEAGARTAAESVRASIERIAGFIAEEGIACEFERLPGFLYAENDRDVTMLERELDAAQRAGLRATLTREVPLPYRVVAALRVEDQAQFHPLRYLRGLLKALVATGDVHVFERSRVHAVDDGAPCRVATDGGTVTARAVFLATHTPITKLEIHTKIAPYRSYVLGLALAGAPVPPGLYWDTADPYHYVRRYVGPDGEALLVGGADHKTGQEPDTGARYRDLERWVDQHFPGAKPSYRWSAQVYEPADGLPYIGTKPGAEHVFLATGYAGTGMTFGTLSAMIVSDQIVGRLNPWASLYDASRKHVLASATSFLAENANVARAAVGGMLKSEARSVTQVPRGEGRIVRVGGRQLAVFRDERDQVVALAPHCTHVGCVVGWNPAERSWDCPCHGSRFAPTGEVLEGPAPTALPRVELEDETPARPSHPHP